MNEPVGLIIKFLGKVIYLGRVWIKVCWRNCQFFRFIFPHGGTLAGQHFRPLLWPHSCLSRGGGVTSGNSGKRNWVCLVQQHHLLISPAFLLDLATCIEATFQSAYIHEQIKSSKTGMFTEKWEPRREASNLAMGHQKKLPGGVAFWAESPRIKRCYQLKDRGGMDSILSVYNIQWHFSSVLDFPHKWVIY